VQVTSYCPRCFKGTRFETAARPAEIACRGCGERREVRLTESVSGKNVVDRCVLCGCGHLYVEKDFNGTIGFAVVAAAVAGSAVAWARDVFLAVGILAAAALADLAVWLLSRDRAVCYRCVATYRGAADNPAHGAYELGVAGRFADDYDEQRERHQG
jgi:hypothetical protein